MREAAPVAAAQLGDCNGLVGRLVVQKINDDTLKSPSLVDDRLNLFGSSRPAGNRDLRQSPPKSMSLGEYAPSRRLRKDESIVIEQRIGDVDQSIPIGSKCIATAPAGARRSFSP